MIHTAIPQSVGHWIDPRGRPQITIFTQSVRPSVPKLQNQATITAGRDCGLAEWIIDDSCLVFSFFAFKKWKQMYLCVR